MKSRRSEKLAVVVYRPGVVLLIGPNKDWAKYQLDGISRHDLNGAVLSVDIDGVHVVTREEHSFVQYVPGIILHFTSSG